MSLPRTSVRDRSGDHFQLSVMGLPASPQADGGPIRSRRLSDDVLELIDGIGRKRIIRYQNRKIVQMTTTISGPHGVHERVDQRKGGLTFISAFSEPGKSPRVVSWVGELLARTDRGLINYVTLSRERLYETADGRIVQERRTRAGSKIYAWLDRHGRMRSKQIHDAAGRRHVLAYDLIGVARIRLHDGTELTRVVDGLWETSRGEPIHKLELLEDGSIRWDLDKIVREVRGDGTSAVRTESEYGVQFTRRESDGTIGSSIRIDYDPSGCEKTVLRDAQGILSIRIASPRPDGGYDVRTIERARPGADQPTWRVSHQAPPGKAPNLDRLSLLPAASGESRYVIANIDEHEDGIIYSFPDKAGMYLERTDGSIERVA